MENKKMVFGIIIGMAAGIVLMLIINYFSRPLRSDLRQGFYPQGMMGQPNRMRRGIVPNDSDTNKATSTEDDNRGVVIPEIEQTAN